MPKHKHDHSTHISVHADPQVLARLDSIVHLLEELKMLDATTQAKLDDLKAKLTDAAAGLSADIADLKAKVGNGASTADINAALDELSAKVEPLTALDAETTQDAPAGDGGGL